MLRGSVPSASSRSQHTFSRAPQVSTPRSTFNRSHSVKTTFNEGYLVPILADEMLPGDTFHLQMDAFARVATLMFPIMDNLYLETFFFFVPNRLVWDNWEQFCGFQVNPGDSTDFTIPQTTSPAMGGVAEGTLCDYFGIPTLVPNLSFNSLHLRAYNFIWNEWFRHQDLQDSVVVDLDDGPDTYTDYVLLQRGKRYDYFTSCLPFPQKGPDVELPLGQSAPVERVPNSTNWLSYQAGTNTLTDPNLGMFTNPSLAGQMQWNPGGTGASLDPNGGLIADLSSATAANINDIRLAFQMQRYYEKQARSGTRYTEVIKGMFGVDSPDMRLQRPEYIGGGSSPVLVNPIAQTSPTVGSNALASLGAYGVCAPESHGFTYSATEHGVVLGLVCVRADINYQSGLDRMWSRQTFVDYYWSVFAHLGEQAVLNQEIFAQGPAAIDPGTGLPYDTEVFGYQERYGEYRYKPSLITGLFRSNATGTLDSWHLAQDFATLPELNEEFIVEEAPMARIKAVAASYDFLFDCMFKYQCARPMPTYAVPGWVDHF